MSGHLRPERLGFIMSDFVFLLRDDAAGVEQAMGTPERAQKSLQA